MINEWRVRMIEFSGKVVRKEEGKEGSDAY
jgi:hypothetical protein